MTKSFTQPNETQNKRRWLVHPFRLKACSRKIKLHSKFFLHGKILNTEFNISMSTKRKPVMDGSVLGTLRLDDSDCLRSGILQAEAEFLVSVSAVEGIPSPWLLLWMLISMKSTLLGMSSANLLKCKECSECSLILQEQTLKRKGCANHLRLFRVSCLVWLGQGLYHVSQSP